MNSNPQIDDARIDRLHRHGVVDMHFDLLLDLYDRREQADLLKQDYWPALEAGGVGVLGVAIYVEDKYMPEMALRVALGQIARLYAEVDRNPRFAICRSHGEIVAARQAGQVALLITMEGVEPLGTDLNLLRVFYELGLRSVGLTHARRNMAGDGGVFAPSGSSREGLSAFGKEVVKQSEALGMIIDLAHLNPAGVDDVLALTTRPLIISHTNPRHYYDIERNSRDEHIKAVGQRGGVVGVNAVLVSPRAEDSTIDRYIDHIEYVAELAGADNVGIGFDFIDHVYRHWSEAQKAELERKLVKANFLPDLRRHEHARNLTRRLIERGYRDGEIEKILYGNWMRVFQSVLGGRATRA